MTNLDIKKLRATAEKATQGEWYWIDGNALISSIKRKPVVLTTNAYPELLSCDLSTGILKALHGSGNAKHIATFNPATVIALLDRIEELEKQKVTVCGGVDPRYA